MLSGLPGSGKSTHVANMRMDLVSTIILSTDYYVERYAKEEGKTYNEVFKEYIGEAHRMMNHALQFALDNRKDIIWDQTNLTRKIRMQKLNRIPDTYNKKCIFFDITIDQALERNNRPGKIIPEDVLWNMNATVEAPTLDEGFSYVYRQPQV